MQKPSWVHTSSSSLVVAFEDPDGMRLKSLLVAWHLFAFGTRATIRKWKQRANKCKQPFSNNDIKSEDEDKDFEILTRALTPTQAPHAVVSLQTPENQLFASLSRLDDSPPIQTTYAPPQQAKGRQRRARKPSTFTLR
jgi:hypothetical protein